MPVKTQDLTGQRFDRWLVLERVSNVKKHHRYQCRCECGTEKVIYATNLRRGVSKSCGCLIKQRASEVHKKHHLIDHPYYKLWQTIKTRLNNINSNSFLNYGGRGIKMHLKWEGDAESFVKYLRMALGPKPTKQHSLDRIDNDQGYFPGNLRWATKKEQANNRRPRQRKSA